MGTSGTGKCIFLYDEHMVQKYRNDLLAGRRVVVIAHSQGNLFANDAVSQVRASLPDQAESIRIIGVANPSNIQLDHTTYYTADDDRVIEALRLGQDVLPANLDNDPGLLNDHRDFLNHNFIKSYFSSYLLSREKIDNDLFAFIRVMPFPDILAGDGAIRVTLEWGAEPDVDLHVFEPNGAHVYYASRVGPSGFLEHKIFPQQLVLQVTALLFLLQSSL